MVGICILATFSHAGVVDIPSEGRDVINIDGASISIFDDFSINFTLTYKSLQEIPASIPMYDQARHGDIRSSVVILQTDLSIDISYLLRIDYLRRNIDDDRRQLDLLLWNSTTKQWKSVGFDVSDHPELYSYVMFDGVLPRNNEQIMFVVTSKVSLAINSFWFSSYGLTFILFVIVFLSTIAIMLKSIYRRYGYNP